MEAHALASGLRMPSFSKKVPLKIAAPVDDATSYGIFFAERDAAGLTSVKPDPRRHSHPMDAIEETMKMLGLQEAQSKHYIGHIWVTVLSSSFETEEHHLARSSVLILDDVRVDLWPLLQHLEAAHEGLGETFNWWLKDALKDESLPGVHHVSSVFNLYSDSHYEGIEDEEKIREYLIEARYCLDDIDNMVPSGIYKSLGHKMVVNPVKRIKSKKKLLDAMRSAGIRNAAYLVNLLTVDLQKAVKEAGECLQDIQKTMGWSNGYYRNQGRYDWVLGLAGEHQLSFFLDQNNQDFGNNGDCIDSLILQNVYLPHGSRSSSIDGLAALCKVVNAIQLVEHVICAFDKSLTSE